MKCINSNIKYLFPSLTIIVSFILIINGLSCVNYDNEKIKKIEGKGDGCVILYKNRYIPYDSVYFIHHHEMLLNHLNEESNIWLNIIELGEDRINQSRNIYFAILVAIIGYILIYTRKPRLNELEGLKKVKRIKFRADSRKLRSIILLTAICIVFLMYIIDIQMNSLQFKPSYRRSKIKQAARQIININPSDKNWYYFDDSLMNKQLHDYYGGFNIRSKRKIKRGINPNLIQIIYYILPSLLISIWLLHHNCKRE